MRDQLILKADIEGSIGMGRESHASLAGKILGLAVFVTHGVADLKRDENDQWLPTHSCPLK